MNEKRNIDKLFEQGLKGYKPKAPIHAWDRLDHSLTMVARKRKLFYFRIAAATVAILFAFGAGYFIANYTNQIELASSTNKTSHDQITKNDDLQNTISKEELNTDVNEPENLEDLNRGGKDKEKIENTFADAISVSKTLKSNELISYQSNLPILNKKFDNSTLTDKNQINHLDYLTAENVISQTDVHSISTRKSQNSEIRLPKFENKEIERIEYGYGIPDKQKTIHYKWAVGAQFAPTYSYRDISTDYSSGKASSVSAEDNFNKAEEAMRSYSGGVNVDFHVSSRWMLQSGLYISQIGQVNKDALQFVQNNNDYVLYAISTSTGAIDIIFEKVPDDIKKFDAPKDTISSIDLDNVSIRQQFELFEIPFLVKYKLLNKKFSVNLAGGLSPAYLLNNDTYLEVGNEKHDIGDASNLNSVIVNSSVGIGLEYLFARKFSISFEPTFKYSLSPINNNSQFYYHPYYFSLFTGIKYSF